jgi:hypothetical protein
MKSKLLPLLIILISIAGGCTNKDKVQNDEISDNLRQWYLFQKGSFWIYRNETTQQIDCTYIDKDPEVTQRWVGTTLVDDISINFNSTFLGDLGINPYCVSIYYKHDFYPVFYPSVGEGKEMTGISTNFEYIKLYDSLNINNHIYTDVRDTRFSVRLEFSVDSVSSRYFYARYIGLIKYTNSKSGIDTTWSLLRWNIVQ